MQPVVAAASLAAARSAMGAWGDALVTSTGSTTSRDLAHRFADYTNILDWGADPTGVADCSAAINAAAATGISEIYFPPGLYTIGKISPPTTLHAIIGSGPKTVFLPGANSSGQPFWNFYQTSELLLENFCLVLPAYPGANDSNIGIQLNQVSNFRLKNLRLVGGRFPIYATGCVSGIIDSCLIYSYAQSAVWVEGASYDVSVINTQTTGPGTSSAIVVLGCFHCSVINCKVHTAGDHLAPIYAFGISLKNGGYNTVANNFVIDSSAEAIQIEDTSYNVVIGNICLWSNSALSTDMGISLFGNAGTAAFNVVADNYISSCGGSGIGLAGNAYQNKASNNLINGCAQNVANHSGIILYGNGCTENDISGNAIIDYSGKHKYGIDEDVTLGLAVGNKIRNNRIYGWITKAIYANPATTDVLQNTGDIWKSNGTATVGAASTTVVVNHGLSRTPTVKSISVTPAGPLLAAAKFYVDSVTATQFTIHTDVVPGGAGVLFAWQATVE
jgi:parallel beta-helix repeat protein